jgi:DNA polymerase III subunit delta
MLLIHGENSYASLERLLFLKSASIKKGYEISNIDGDEVVSAIDVISMGDSLDMFGSKKIIFVKRLLSNKKSDIVKKIVDWLGKQALESNTTEFVFWEDGAVAKNLRFYKVFKEKHKLEEFNLNKKFEIEREARKKLNALSPSLGGNEVGTFLEVTNLDEADITSELNKLSFSSKLDKDTFYSLVASRGNITAWNFIDRFIQAYFNRDKEDLKGLTAEFQRLVAQDENEIRLLSLMIRQVRILIRVKLLLMEQRNSNEIASKLRLQFFKIRDYISDSERYSLNDLVALFEKLIIMETKIKTGQTEFPFLDFLFN